MAFNVDILRNLNLNGSYIIVVVILKTFPLFYYFTCHYNPITVESKLKTAISALNQSTNKPKCVYVIIPENVIHIVTFNNIYSIFH